LAPFAGWLRYLRPYQYRALSEAAAQHYYQRRPLAGVHQINRLLRHLTPQLEAINAPVLALHGEGDQVVDIESGRRLVERLGSPHKLYRRFGPDAPHVLTTAKSPCREEVLALSGEFLVGLEAQQGGASNC
jgi:alpha-beta hydrolase superfamily lysophospholipase